MFVHIDFVVSFLTSDWSPDIKSISIIKDSKSRQVYSLQQDIHDVNKMKKKEGRKASDRRNFLFHIKANSITSEKNLDY